MDGDDRSLAHRVQHSAPLPLQRGPCRRTRGMCFYSTAKANWQVLEWRCYIHSSMNNGLMIQAAGMGGNVVD